VGRRYTNLDGTTPDKGLGDLIKWSLERKRAPETFVVPRRENDGTRLRAPEPHATWIGHATFTLRLGGKLISTDPVWSDRLHTIRRFAAPGVRLEDVPGIDVVTVSHAHYDHLDMPTLKRIGDRTLYVVPKDNRDILTGGGLRNVVELDWWETHRAGDLAITLVPAQHWSMRVPWDRNKRLWGGFLYEAPEGTAYHAGDTAFSERVFAEIAKRFPRIDWAMLPIGAYEPQWFMQPQHMGPEEAGRAFEILGARNLLAMHWGTFKLTDEPLGEPPARLRAWAKSAGVDDERVWIFDVGETRAL
jgi:L-ascorbate metabolism protein UlaG (beta-lactamase superfamily)